MKKFLLLISVIICFSSFSALAGADTLWTQLLPMSISNVVFAPDGQSIYASGRAEVQNRVMQFDLQGKLLNTYDTIGRIKQFSKDGKYYWTTNCEKYDYTTLKRIDTLPVIPYDIPRDFAICENADLGVACQFVTVGLKKNQMYMFKLSDLQNIKRIEYPVDGVQFDAVTVSPDAKYLALDVVKYSLNDKYEYVPYIKIEIWETKSLKPIKVLSDTTGVDIVYTLKFSPDGKYLGVSYGGTKLWLYNTSDWSLAHVFDYSGVMYEYPVSSFMFSKDNLNFYIGCNGIEKINLSDFKPSFTHKWTVNNKTIDESPDNSKLVCDRSERYLILLDNTYTGITEPEPMNGITLSPNPVKETLNITFTTEIAQTLTYSISNVEGNIVISLIKKELTEGTNQLAINISEFSTGIYFFNATIDGQTKSYKFVVER